MKRKIKKFQKIDDTVLKSGLPNTLDLDEIKEHYNINTVIDLSDRERKTVMNWCVKNNVNYHKFYIDRKNPSKEDYLKALSLIRKTTLVFCFHGLSRSRTLVALWEIKNGKLATPVIDKLRVEFAGQKKELLNLIAEISLEI